MFSSGDAAAVVVSFRMVPIETLTKNKTGEEKVEFCAKDKNAIIRCSHYQTEHILSGVLVCLVGMLCSAGANVAAWSLGMELHR